MFSYISYDRGTNWNNISGAFQIPAQTKFLNKDTIISISNYGSGGEQSYFSISMDSGESWEHKEPCQLSIPDADCFLTEYDMYMDGFGVGYILAYVEKTWYDFHGNTIDNMSLLYTDDYGVSWTSFVTDYSEEMYSMGFVNDSLAFIGGQDGLLLKWDLTIPLQNILEIADSHTFADFSIYPNPMENFLYINWAALNPFQFQIYAMSGELVKTGFVAEGELDLSNLISGQYIFKAISPEGIYTTLIVKL